MSRANVGQTLLLAAVFAANLTGCGPRKGESDTPPPPVIAVTEETRAALQKQAPDALIGRVIAARPQDQLVAVGDVPTDQFKEGDIVTFYGGRDQVIGTGSVVAKTADAIHVRYQPPKPGQRAPTTGDLAIRFRK